jgi:antitoxin MazE
MQSQKILRWGNSLALRLPMPFARSAQLAEGSTVKLSLAKGRIIVEPLPEAGLSLKKLLSQITAGNLHRETDTGQAKGFEVW